MRELPGVTPETRQRVRDAAKASGYRTHPFATRVMSQLRRGSKAKHVGTHGVKRKGVFVSTAGSGQGRAFSARRQRTRDGADRSESAAAEGGNRAHAQYGRGASVTAARLCSYALGLSLLSGCSTAAVFRRCAGCAVIRSSSVLQRRHALRPKDGEIVQRRTQSCTGIVHFFSTRHSARNNSFNAASSFGNAGFGMRPTGTRATQRMRVRERIFGRRTTPNLSIRFGFAGTIVRAVRRSPRGILSPRKKAAPLISRCLSLVTMVQSADLRNRHDLPDLRRLHWSRFWRILRQGEMSS